MSNKSELLKKEQAAFEKMQAEHEFKKKILEALDEELNPDSINAFGYCADGSLRFGFDASGSALSGMLVSELLEKLPAIPAVFVSGSSVTTKPVESLRESDQGKRINIFPVYLQRSGKDSFRTRWWTKVAGHTIQIEAQQASLMELTGEQAYRYEIGGYSYSTGSVQLLEARRKRVGDVSVPLSPMSLWDEAWAAWALEQGWNEKQMQFIRMFKVWCLHDERFSLPAVGETPHWFARMGDFRLVFTGAQVAEIEAFALSRQAELPGIKITGLEMIDKVEKWIKNFFATQGFPFPRVTRSHGGNLELEALETLRYLIRKELQLAVGISWVSEVTDGGGIEVCLTVDKEVARFKCGYSVDAPAIDWDSLIEYF